MKNKIAITSAFLAASSFSMGEIVINDSLSFQGYVDSSYLRGDFNNVVNSSIEETQIDKVEISWLFDFEAVTVQVDLEYDGVSSDITAQQAFVSYALSGGSVVTVGRYVSMLGFEAKKPTGLFQSSTAYSIPSLKNAFINLDFNTLFGGLDGVKYTTGSDTTFFGISVSQSNDIDGGDDMNIVEVAASLDLGGGFSVFGGGSFSGSEGFSYEHYNAYVTYETGAWLFAAELNATVADDDIDDDYIYSGLLMANYEYSDIASVTARFSAFDFDQVAEFKKYTLAHNYDFSDSLLLVTEVSHLDFGGPASLTEYAVKLLFSF